MIELLAQVEGKDGRGRPFSAGIVLWDDRVVVTAPILRRALARKTRDQVRDICARNGWRISVVHEVRRERETAGNEYQR
jgi:hypothetical protein